MFAENGKLKPEDCSSFFSMFLPDKSSVEIIRIMFESFDTGYNLFHILFLFILKKSKKIY